MESSRRVSVYNRIDEILNDYEAEIRYLRNTLADNHIPFDPNGRIYDEEPSTEAPKNIGKPGRMKQVLGQNSFGQLLLEQYRAKAEQIISWIRKEQSYLEQHPEEYVPLRGHKRSMAPLHAVIHSGVFIPKSNKDNRPNIDGKAFERFFSLPDGSYSKYSKRVSMSGTDIETLKKRFAQEVLNCE